MIRSANPMNCKPVKDTTRLEWHEVSKVQHYWLDVSAMTKPMQKSIGSSASGSLPTTENDPCD